MKKKYWDTLFVMCILTYPLVFIFLGISSFFESETLSLIFILIPIIIGFVIFPISVVIEMQKRKDILWSIAWLFLLPIVISPIYYLKKIRKTLR